MDAGRLMDELPERVKSQFRKSVRIRTKECDHDSLGKGCSRIGGLPDVPDVFDWPRYMGYPLSFIAQIRLEDLVAYDLDLPLPKQGSLLFFYDSQQRTWGFDPKDRGSGAVYYIANATQELCRRQPPEDLPEMGWFRCCKLEFEASINLPDPWSIHFNPELSDSEMGKVLKYLELSHGQNAGPIHRLAGHADCVQNAMEYECELVTNSLYCGDSSGYEDPRSQQFRSTAKDWRLLLQIDSDDNSSMMWGDLGMIYFWIKETDLKDGRFENIWTILQCS